MQPCLSTRLDPTLGGGERIGVFQPRESDDLPVGLTLLGDLSGWISTAKLLEWIQAEIERLDCATPRSDALELPSPDYPRTMMLALLAFAYTTGIFSSEEIARKCLSDTLFNSICQSHAPPGMALWNFRRRNRPLLERILARVFLLAIEERFGLDVTLLPPELEKDLCDRAAERLDLARHLDIDE